MSTAMLTRTKDRVIERQILTPDDTTIDSDSSDEKAQDPPKASLASATQVLSDPCSLRDLKTPNAEFLRPSEASNNLSSFLNKADFDTINELIKSALIEILLPEVTALQERLGVEPLNSLPRSSLVLTPSVCLNASPLVPDSPPAQRRDSFASIVRSSDKLTSPETKGFETLPSTTSSEAVTNLELEKSKTETGSSPTPSNNTVIVHDKSSPSDSLRRWLARTSNGKYKSRLEELLQEAEEVHRNRSDMKNAVVGITKNVTTSPSECTAPSLETLSTDQIGRSDEAGVLTTQGQSGMLKSKTRDASRTAIDQVSELDPLRAASASSAPATSSFQTIANTDASPWTRCLAELKLAMQKNKAGQAKSAFKSVDRLVKIQDCRKQPAMESSASITQCSRETYVSKACDTSKWRSVGIAADEPVDLRIDTSVNQNQAGEDKAISAAFDALRIELTNDMADLKKRLQTIPDLTERKSARFDQPERGVIQGPRPLPRASTSCLGDIFKSGRSKKDREHVDQLFSKLLDSLDELKADIRASESSKSTPQESPQTLASPPRKFHNRSPRLSTSSSTLPSQASQEMLPPPWPTGQALARERPQVTIPSGTGGISYAVSAQGAGKKLGRITVDRPRGARQIPSPISKSAA